MSWHITTFAPSSKLIGNKSPNLVRLSLLPRDFLHYCIFAGVLREVSARSQLGCCHSRRQVIPLTKDKKKRPTLLYSKALSHAWAEFFLLTKFNIWEGSYNTQYQVIPLTMKKLKNDPFYKALSPCWTDFFLLGKFNIWEVSCTAQYQAKLYSKCQANCRTGGIYRSHSPR